MYGTDRNLAQETDPAGSSNLIPTVYARARRGKRRVYAGTARSKFRVSRIFGIADDLCL